MNHLLRAAPTLLTVPLTSFLHFIRLVVVHRRDQALAKSCGPYVVGSGALRHVATMK